MKTDCRPNRFRKYHERLETHRTSRSRVATPDWSMDLKRMVSGKGSFTARRLAVGSRSSADFIPLRKGGSMEQAEGGV